MIGRTGVPLRFAVDTLCYPEWDFLGTISLCSSGSYRRFPKVVQEASDVHKRIPREFIPLIKRVLKVLMQQKVRSELKETWQHWMKDFEIYFGFHQVKIQTRLFSVTLTLRMGPKEEGISDDVDSRLKWKAENLFFFDREGRSILTRAQTDALLYLCNHSLHANRNKMPLRSLLATCSKFYSLIYAKVLKNETSLIVHLYPENASAELNSNGDLVLRYWTQTCPSSFQITSSTGSTFGSLHIHIDGVHELGQFIEVSPQDEFSSLVYIYDKVLRIHSEKRLKQLYSSLQNLKDLPWLSIRFITNKAISSVVSISVFRASELLVSIDSKTGLFVVGCSSPNLQDALVCELGHQLALLLSDLEDPSKCRNVIHLLTELRAVFILKACERTLRLVGLDSLRVVQSKFPGLTVKSKSLNVFVTDVSESPVLVLQNHGSSTEITCERRNDVSTDILLWNQGTLLENLYFVLKSRP